MTLRQRTADEIAELIAMSSGTSVLNELVRLENDNARLRELIKEAEVPDYPDRCPWCGLELVLESESHSDNCRAFNPDGTVK